MEPVTTKIATKPRLIFIVLMCGVKAENNSGQTATAFIPAASLGSYLRSIRAGIKRKPGPMPRKPASMDIGIASKAANVKLGSLGDED